MTVGTINMISSLENISDNLNLQKLLIFIENNKNDIFIDYKILLTRRCSQGILLRYKNIFNIKISSKGKIMISTLGKKTELD
jgi:hypothetical protein